MPLTLTLCADDFGASTGIDGAIESLLAQGRLSAVSCLSNGPAWRLDGERLARHAPAVSIGLHLNLTDGAPLSAALARVWPRLPPLRRLLGLAALGQLPLAAIGEEIDAQWRAFAEVTGRQPDHVDGHQHVHALPGVREPLVERIRACGTRPWVRSTAHLAGPGFALKRRVIEACGGRGLQHLLVQCGLSHSGVLAGCYDLREPDYGRLLAGWLDALPTRGAVLYCHPGWPSPDGRDDPIAEARRREAEVLEGLVFDVLRQTHALQLLPRPLR